MGEGTMSSGKKDRVGEWDRESTGVGGRRAGGKV